MRNKRTLPDFASGVIITCPAPFYKGAKIACFKPVSLTRKQWLGGTKGLCPKHKKGINDVKRTEK